MGLLCGARYIEKSEACWRCLWRSPVRASIVIKKCIFFLHVEFVVGMAFYEFLYIEFVVGVAFSEFLSCIIGSGCCVLGGCLGWSSIRLSIVIKVCISFLTCRNCSRRFGVVLSVTICGGRRSVPLL